MSSVLRIAEDLTKNKKIPIYRAYIKSQAATCIMLQQAQADQIAHCWPDSKLWPSLLMSGHTPGSKFFYFIYDVVLSPVEWNIRTTRDIHARLSAAMSALHTSTACVLYPGKAVANLADIMAENQAKHTTYYLVNFSNLMRSNSAAAYHLDQVKLIDMLCKGPVEITSAYKFYKYLAKSSVYPAIARLIKEKPNTQVYFIKIRLLFMLKHFDLYLRACGVSEPTYNKLCHTRHPDAAYYIKHLV